MNFKRLLNTELGIFFVSVLLGIGLATLFRSVCKDKECVVFHAPPLEEIKDKIYKFDNKCYKYVPMPTKCDSSKKILDFI
jgi:hypothetical protein